MTDISTEIRVPKVNNNDTVYTLVEWLVGDEQPVETGETIATLETSKSVEDLVCDATGVLWQDATAGAEYEPGQLIARVVPPGTPRERSAPPPAERADGPVITAPAQALLDELGIAADRVHTLGVPLVRRADVERLVAESEPDRRHVLSPVQRAVGRTVSRSHRTIPAAYAVVRVDVGAAQQAAARLGVRLRAAIGLPELLIAAVAPLHEDFPLCFAEPLDEESALLPDDAHIGVTIDAGRGLFVPVVKNASGQDVERIAQAMRRFRRNAERNEFRAEELDGGNITISLNHEPGVVAAIPVIFPGQTCAVTLTGARTELGLDDEGTVVPRTVTDIGLAYDHRFVNGRDAVLFLQRIRQALESESSD